MKLILKDIDDKHQDEQITRLEQTASEKGLQGSYAQKELAKIPPDVREAKAARYRENDPEERAVGALSNLNQKIRKLTGDTFSDGALMLLRNQIEKNPEFRQAITAKPKETSQQFLKAYGQALGLNV